MVGEEEGIKTLIEELLGKMGLEGKVELLETTENLAFHIKAPQAGLLIGENGENLAALSHLVKRLVEKNFGKTRLPLALDVNDYQAKKTEELRDLAVMSAKRVRFFKKEVLLRPMTSFERRVIHAALTEYPDITTESRGQEPGRYVVIKPFEI